MSVRGDRHECRDTGGDHRHDRRALQRMLGYRRPDEHAHPGEHGQKQRQPIDETDRDRAAGGNQAVAAGGPGYVGREGVSLPVDVVGVCDRRVLDDGTEAPFRGRDQFVAPRGRRNLLPINELPPALEALALGGVHRRLPANVDQRPLGTVQAAGSERKGDGEYAQGEGSGQPGDCHRLSINRYMRYRCFGTGRRSP